MLLMVKMLLNYIWSGLIFSENFVCNADDDVPSKTAKVDIPSTPFVGGMAPPPMGAGYPPRPNLGPIRPVYACWNFFSF
jgi:hypothetical protein